MTRSRRAIGDRYAWQSREKYREKWLAQARRELDAKLARAGTDRASPPERLVTLFGPRHPLGPPDRLTLPSRTGAATRTGPKDGHKEVLQACVCRAASVPVPGTGPVRQSDIRGQHAIDLHAAVSGTGAELYLWGSRRGPWQSLPDRCFARLLSAHRADGYVDNLVKAIPGGTDASTDARTRCSRSRRGDDRPPRRTRGRERIVARTVAVASRLACARHSVG